MHVVQRLVVLFALGNNGEVVAPGNAENLLNRLLRQLANRLLANLARDPELVPLADVLEVAGGKTFHLSELAHQVRTELIEKTGTPIRLCLPGHDIGDHVPIKLESSGVDRNCRLELNLTETRFQFAQSLAVIGVVLDHFRTHTPTPPASAGSARRVPPPWPSARRAFR